MFYDPKHIQNVRVQYMNHDVYMVIPCHAIIHDQHRPPVLRHDQDSTTNIYGLQDNEDPKTTSSPEVPPDPNQRETMTSMAILPMFMHFMMHMP